MGDLTINGAALLAAIGALCSVIVYLHRQSEAQHEREVNRLVDGYEDRLKEVKELAMRATTTTEQAVGALTRDVGTGAR